MTDQNNPFSGPQGQPQQGGVQQPPGGGSGLYGPQGQQIPAYQIRVFKVPIPVPTNDPEVLARHMVRQGPNGQVALAMQPDTQLLWLETGLAFDQRDQFISEIANRVNRVQSALMLVLEYLWKTDQGKTPEFQAVLRQVKEYVGVPPEDLQKDAVPAFAGQALDFSDPTAHVLSVLLHGRYVAWCKSQGAHDSQICDELTFRQKMVQTGFTLQPVPKGLAFMGVKLKPDAAGQEAPAQPPAAAQGQPQGGGSPWGDSQ